MGSLIVLQVPLHHCVACACTEATRANTRVRDLLFEPSGVSSLRAAAKMMDRFDYTDNFTVHGV